jgi:predicted membrane protein
MEQEIKTYRRHRHHHGVSFAFLLIAAGLIFLGFNTGTIPIQYKNIFISWQMLLIVLGFASFFKRHFLGGMVLVVIGGFFLVPEINRVNPDWLGPIPTDFIHLYWPVLLIAAGALVLLQWMFPSRNCWKKAEFEYRHHRRFRHENFTEGYINSNNVFGSGEHIVLDPEFKGGEINSVFGGTTLDLRKTNLKEGTTKLEINVVFGGVTLYVPETWNVVIHTDCVFGGFEDKRFAVNSSIDTSRTLVIYGSCVFGGGEIKN